MVAGIVSTLSEAIQKEFVKQYDSKYSAADKSVPDNKAITFNPPKDDEMNTAITS
jgi:hypothetical protein